MRELAVGSLPAVTTVELADLLAPIGIEQFFAEIWEKRPAIFSLPPNDFSKILAAVGPLQVERLASLAREGSQAWLSNEYIAHSVVPVDSVTARHYLDIGANLYFLNIPLPDLTDKIADALGAPRHRVIASIFLTPAGSGAAPHFDKNENFTIQLTGHKSWTVGNRPAISNPHKSYVFGQPLPATLRRLGMDLHQTIPATSHVLLPGTMLYVPRGATHRTNAKENSWSLNISYTGLAWVDLLTAGLREHFLTRPDWRRSVVGVTSGSSQAARDQNIMPALIAEMEEILARPDIAKTLCQHILGQIGE
jgi:ribosomal protein L16 Arg81 hydroxylase